MRQYVKIPTNTSSAPCYFFIHLKQKEMAEKDLEYWKKNAEENYDAVPISVLRYISELEKFAKKISLKLLENGVTLKNK